MSRKRPAPGTSPVGYSSTTQPMQSTYQNGAQNLNDDQFFNWGATGQNPSTYPNQPMYNMPAPAFPPQQITQPSNQLTRRHLNQVVPRPQQQDNQWPVEQAATSVQQQQQQQQQQEPPTTWSDDIDELVAKAQVAKREAQSKRKQIPPFVMKLHSFLENPKNTDLIRWADDGKSFVVLNEDEFANKLIPELFKHNNYASFVRQLNMYGFHKKVGLSDNSMRASERKAKSPSEYFNPFFRRGYPDLLWLIQKPKNQAATTKTKPRGKSEEREDDEEYPEEASSVDQSRPRPQLALPPTSGNNTALSQEQFASVTRELSLIRRQQSQITQMLGQLKREHDALVDQANDYQNKHSRHEHSINAILTFLATLYNRSLQNHEGAADIAKIFANTLNQDKNGSGVVDDHFVFDMPEGTPVEQSHQPYKRQRLMITDGTEGRASTMSPSTSAASPIPRPSRRSSRMARSPQSAHVEEIFDPDVNQPAQNYQPSTGQQHQDMMSLIHSTNARNSGNNTPVPDFSHVLNDLESQGGTTPISAAQRESMLRMFNDQSKGSRPGTSSSNALVSPVRTNSQMHFDNKLQSTQQDLDKLAQLQAAQDDSVKNLANILQPLSPSGSIPGLGDGQDVQPPPLNIDDFLNPTDYFADYNAEGTNNGNLDFSNLNNLNNNAYNSNGNAAGFDFADDDPLFGDVDDNKSVDNNFLNVGTYDGHNDATGRIESVSGSEATTPKISGSDAGDWDGHVQKKRRVS
ncbi:Heat shock transcription factor [Knufia fluminis]|uniref:Heat shock transcription factor n=1 Tax=Knufia fluminis TaxID=191047 RepID=A0AAN8ECS1_9EURO|nr:Heat shock transcription factor [Knufia fluminis]